MGPLGIQSYGVLDETLEEIACSNEENPRLFSARRFASLSSAYSIPDQGGTILATRCELKHTGEQHARLNRHEFRGAQESTSSRTRWANVIAASLLGWVTTILALGSASIMNCGTLELFPQPEPSRWSEGLLTSTELTCVAVDERNRLFGDTIHYGRPVVIYREVIQGRVPTTTSNRGLTVFQLQQYLFSQCLALPPLSGMASIPLD